MRRRDNHNRKVRIRTGNTSAYAEKSGARYLQVHHLRKYLRVCGEETPAAGFRTITWEIPPRMRRRVWVVVQVGVHLGNTSAYAEKRAHGCKATSPTWKYLRVCGEESSRPAVFTKKFLQVREFRQIRSQAATDHRSPESLGDYSPSYLRRTPALGWDHY